MDRFGSICSRYGFGEIETPVLERGDMYKKCLGGTSDVVAREMFAVGDSGVVLRPEGTAGVVRALVEAGVGKGTSARGARVWYAGPMFRYERPQFMRWRQFVQLGVEVVGDASVTSDVECMVMASEFLESTVGGRGAKLRINSLGTKTDRSRFNASLHEWLKPRYWAMSPLSRQRFDAGNCMRILDSKLCEDVDALHGAPRLVDFLGADETARFAEVRALLDEADVEHVVDERLVRGLDYYTSTAFEFEGARGRAVCAGGRYHNLLGAHGVGFAIGLDRVEDPALFESSRGVAAFERFLDGGVAVVAISKLAETSQCLIGQAVRRVTRDLRREGVPALARLEGSRRVSKTLPRVIRAGARAVVFIGPDDIRDGNVQVKVVDQSHPDKPSTSHSVSFDNLVPFLRDAVVESGTENNLVSEAAAVAERRLDML